MILGKDIKKVFPYFNKIITDTLKAKTVVEIKSFNKSLIFTLITEDKPFIAYSIDSDLDEFNGLLFNYKDCVTALKPIKAKDEVIIKYNHKDLEVEINGEVKSTISPISSSHVKTIIPTSICFVDLYKLYKSIEENKYIANKGLLDYHNYLFIEVKDSNMMLFQTNDIALMINCFSINQVIKKNGTFVLSNNHISNLYKWLDAIKNTNIEVLISKEYIYFKTKNELIQFEIETVNKIKELTAQFNKMNELNFEYKTTIDIEEFKSLTSAELDKIKQLKSEGEKEIDVLDISQAFNLDVPLYIKKKLGTLIPVLSSESKVHLIDNPLNPIMIYCEDEISKHKLIINTAKQKEDY